MMKALLSVPVLVFLALVAGLSFLPHRAGAEIRWADTCVWSPDDPAVCRGRNVCFVNVRDGRCARYCRINPYDVACKDVYRRPSVGPRPAPGVSPYPWARGGDFCEFNPYTPECFARRSSR